MMESNPRSTRPSPLPKDEVNPPHLHQIFQNTDGFKLSYIMCIRSDYFIGKNYITEIKRALRYIHPHILYVGFTVRVGAKLRR